MFDIDLLQPAVVLSTFNNTSVTITWTQPLQAVVQYTVQISRSSNQIFCPSFVEDDQSTTTSPSVRNATFTGLQEFSQYNITVTPASTLIASGSISFTTLSSGKINNLL